MISLINHDSRARSQWGRDEIYPDKYIYITNPYGWFISWKTHQQKWMITRATQTYIYIYIIYTYISSTKPWEKDIGSRSNWSHLPIRVSHHDSIVHQGPGEGGLGDPTAKMQKTYTLVANVGKKWWNQVSRVYRSLYIYIFKCVYIYTSL